GYGYDGYAPPPPPPMMAAPASQPVMVAAPPVYAPLPRLGIGVYAGSVDIDGRTQGGELGLFGRLRLTEKLYVEGEVAQAELTNSHIDNRAGASLLFDFSPRSRFSLNVLGGLGLTQTETSDAFEDKSYGELGLGVTYRPTQRFQLAADIRAGARSPVEQDFETTDGSSDFEEEGFYRSRLSAMVFF
ncbi:MAG TPA: outer membrane beta-barrel protein, partial [Haliangium sp.]|nr:outer membrane beta-barrel protein [Haliangium sp.]